MREKITVPAMRERDIRELLAQHDIAEMLDRGEVECSCCGEVVTWETLGGIIMKGGTPVPICSGLDCVEHAARRSTDGQPA